MFFQTLNLRYSESAFCISKRNNDLKGSGKMKNQQILKFIS